MGLIKPLCDRLRDDLRLLNIYLPSIHLKRDCFCFWGEGVVFLQQALVSDDTSDLF